MSDTLILKEVELDYEADEGDDIRGDTPTPRGASSPLRSGDAKSEGALSPSGKDLDEGELDQSLSAVEDEGEEHDQSKAEKGGADSEVEEGEELEDGEISDEDETLRNERNEPKPVCRFYSKGQCTWGSSCRFLHPGVLDKGNYSMFATPRPILPGEPQEDQEEEQQEKEPAAVIRPPPPVFETAWERGLRQAKEMRRRSHKRREMDVEYEEKKSSLSLTQIELDKENDYYMRPASPAHTHDPYADDDPYFDSGTYYEEGYSSEVRRVAPPPPPEFLARQEREASSRRLSASPPPGPRVRRVAPPRSPSPDEVIRQPYRRPGEDWADPWMRSRDDKRGRGARRQSYSSGSSRSSGSRGGSDGSSPRRRRRYSSSYSRSSSYSSKSSRSRSRSSSPENIPRRAVQSVRSTAPLQKRLAGITQGKQNNNRQSSSKQINVKQEGHRRDSPGPSKSKDKDSSSRDKQNKDPVKFALPKSQIKMSLKTSSGKPSNNTVLEKFGTSADDVDGGKRKRKMEADGPEAQKLRKLENQELMETLKQRLKTKLSDRAAAPGSAGGPPDADKQKGGGAPADKDPQAGAADKAAQKDKKKKGAGAAGDTKSRREELLKQLKAVEEAITRKRTKLEK